MSVVMMMTMTHKKKTTPVGLLLVLLAVVLLALALSSAEARSSDGMESRSAERRAMYRQYTGWKEQYNVVHERGSEEDLDTFENYETNMEALSEWRQQMSRSSSQVTVGNVTIYAGTTIGRSTFLSAVSSILNLAQVQRTAFGGARYDLNWFNATKYMFYMPPNVSNSGWSTNNDISLQVCTQFSTTNTTQCASTQTNWRVRMASWVAGSWQKQLLNTSMHADAWIAVTINLLNSYGIGMDPKCAAVAGGAMSGTNIPNWNSIYVGLLNDRCDLVPQKRSDDTSEPLPVVERQTPSNWLPLDWRTYNVIVNGTNRGNLANLIHVQNQGSSSLCWAYSVAEHFSALNAIHGGEPVYIAVGQFTYCRNATYDPLLTKMSGMVNATGYTSAQQADLAYGSPNDNPASGWSPSILDMPHYQLMNAMHQGSPMSVSMWAKVAHSIATSNSQYQYQCFASLNNQVDYWTNGYGISTYAAIERGDEVALYNAVRNYPVISCIDSTHTSFILYISGTYYDELCSQVVLSHSVGNWGLLYDDCGQPYWIVRNSWGYHWGTGGQMMMIANRNMCGIATFAVYSQTYKHN